MDKTDHTIQGSSFKAANHLTSVINKMTYEMLLDCHSEVAFAAILRKYKSKYPTMKIEFDPENTSNMTIAYGFKSEDKEYIREVKLKLEILGRKK